MKRLVSFVAIVTLFVPMAGVAQAPGMTRIGAAGAVAGRVEGFLQGAASGKVVESGQPLFENEKISTDNQSRLQVLLKDETVFTIGPNSSMVLDKFVYDPSNDSGKLAVAVKGLFRFVTGRIARRKPSEMEVRMPVGVIGIRGTMVAGEANANGSTVVLLGPGAGNNAGERIGQADVQSNGHSVTLLQPGSAVNIGRDGTLGHVFHISPDQLNNLLGGLGNRQGNNRGNNTMAGGIGSGSDQSGQTTGKGLGNANDTRTDLASFQSANQLLNTVNGTQLLNGPATWDQVRTISFGQAMYTGSGVFTQTLCSGSACNVQGTATFNLQVDFGARTIGGTGSFLSILTTGSFPIRTGNEQISGPSSQPISFAALTDGATFTPTIGTGACGSASVCSFAGSTVTLLNNRGTVAGAAQLNIKYTDNNPSAGYGTAIGTR